MSRLPSISRKTFPSFLIGLCCVSAFLFLFHLGNSPLQDYDEAIYAQVIADTEAHGGFLTLSSSGGAWFEKPPLYFWTAMGSEYIFGHNEFALRFPSAIFGILSILLVCLIAFEISNDTLIALIAGSVLLTTGIFLEAGRQLRLDVPVTAAILFAFYAFLRGRKNQRWYLGVGVGIGIGILIKSIIGMFVLPLIFIWSFGERDFDWLKNKYIWYGFGLGMLTILPWHIYETLKFGVAFWDSYLLHHVFGRFTSDVNGGSMSNVDYIKYITLYGFPWVIVYVVGCLSLVRKSSLTDGTKRTLIATAVCSLFILTVFAFAKTKLTYYVIPAIPFIALFCALWFKYLYETYLTQSARKTLVVGISLFLVLGVVNMIYSGYQLQSDLASNAAIVHDEYQIGTAIAENPEISDVRAFEYFYWDTIRYYGGRPISLMRPGDTASSSFFMIIETNLYKHNPFPLPVMNHLSAVYQGNDLTLLVFQP